MKPQKTFKIIATLMLILFTTGFSFTEKDEAFFLKNPKEAKEKLSSCNKMMNKLAEVGNIEKLEEMTKDPECNAASKAMSTIQRASAKQKREQQKIARNKKRTKIKKLLKKHYQKYSVIPLIDRINSNSDSVKIWTKECREISRNMSDCFTEQLGKSIYETSYEKYSKNTESMNKTLIKCRKYENEFSKNNKMLSFNSRPSAFLSLEGIEGTNECHAAYDVHENELVEKYLYMNMEQRLIAKIECLDSEYDICNKSLKTANKSISKTYNEKLSGNKSAEERQYQECEKLKNKYKKINIKYSFEIKNLGECKAVAFW